MSTSRQITIGRSGLSLADLNLNDLTSGYVVTDNWISGGQQWQHYNASPSAWVNGDRVVGQRLQSVNEVFDILIQASTPAGLKAKIQTIATAISQMRYTLTINWDGDSYSFTANGGGNLDYSSTGIDPDLHANGWTQITLTIPRDPSIG